MADLIAGILGIEDSDRIFINTVGQSVVYNAVADVLAQWNANLTDMLQMFVSGVTTDHIQRYYSMEGGRLQEQGTLAPAGATRGAGQWDVGFPLRQYGTAWGYDEISLAYMTVQEMDRTLAQLTAQGINTVRFEILKALFNSAGIASYDDKIHPVYNIVPLANGDSVVYPPLAGSESGATDNHYLESGYLATAISDVNNPFETLVMELAEHFSGGNEEELEVVTFINRDEEAEVEALTDFTPIEDMHIAPGDDTARLTSAGPNVPGKIIGRVSDSWVSRWAWMPSGYMLSIAVAEEAPLKMRVDPADTGLPQGLGLVAGTDSKFPLHGAQYRHRFGLGVANRLNGAVMELANGGTYTIPTIYA